MKALLFGSIGVLADTSAMQLEAINRAFIAHDLNWNWSEEEYRSMLTQSGGQNRVRWYAESVKGEQISDAAVERIHETKTRLFNDALELHGIQLRPGVLRLLEDAKSSGLATAWVTSTNMSNLQAIANGSSHSGLLENFSHVTHRGTVLKEKPDAAPYVETLKKLGIDPSEAIAIEDTQICLASALEAKLATIVTPTTFSTGQDFSGAASVVSHLGDRDEAATHLSGTSVLDEGLVTISSLGKLAGKGMSSKNHAAEIT